MGREPRDGWCHVGDAGVVEYGPMTADTRIDPLKLQAWIDMNSVTDLAPVPGERFIYVDDLVMALCGGLVEGTDEVIRVIRAAHASCGQEYADSCPQPVELGQRAIPTPAYEAGVATGPEA